MRHPSFIYALISYRAYLPEQLDHGKDQIFKRIISIIMGNRPVLNLRLGFVATAERTFVFANLKATA